MSASDAWRLAHDRLHESMGWSAVLSHALRADPTLHPELFAIVSKPIGSLDFSIERAFEELKCWTYGKTTTELAPALAIWASQTQIEQYSVADLINATPLAWLWGMTLATMPTNQIRDSHHTLVQVLWMEHLAYHQENAEHIDPAMLSMPFSS
jgi:hypothetical protein